MMLLRRADVLLLSVAGWSPPASTADATLALANLLLWKAEIGDAVSPARHPARATDSLTWYVMRRTAGCRPGA